MAATHLTRAVRLTGYNSNLMNFAPRIGFAYRLTKDGKTSLRGGAGFYYTPVFSALVYMVL